MYGQAGKSLETGKHPKDWTVVYIYLKSCGINAQALVLVIVCSLMLLAHSHHLGYITKIEFSQHLTPRQYCLSC